MGSPANRNTVYTIGASNIIMYVFDKKVNRLSVPTMLVVIKRAFLGKIGVKYSKDSSSNKCA
jgi:hypothetical protein